MVPSGVILASLALVGAPPALELTASQRPRARLGASGAQTLVELEKDSEAQAGGRCARFTACGALGSL